MDDMMNITVSKLLEQVARQYPEDEAVKFTDRDYRRTWKEESKKATMWRFGQRMCQSGC